MTRINSVVSTPCNDDGIADTVQPSAVGQGGQQATKPARTARHPHDGLPSRRRQKRASGPSVDPDAHSRKPLTTTKTGLPRMLSIADVAEMFGRAPRTIRSWIERDIFQPIKVGNAVFIPQEQVEALLCKPKSQKTKARKIGR